jgi:hypothetical protein
MTDTNGVDYHGLQKVVAVDLLTALVAAASAYSVYFNFVFVIRARAANQGYASRLVMVRSVISMTAFFAATLSSPSPP